jgi:DNA-binding transcriptional LysR family regulator
MKADLGDLNAFLAVARAGGYRDGARASGVSASGLSEAVRRLEAQLGVRLFNRTTRSVVPTEAGARLLERLGPALTEVDAALDVVNGFRERPAGTLRLNVPVSAVRLVLPAIVPPFLAAYPDIKLEVIAEDSFVDVLAAGCDAGIRFDERLEQDMIAVPIGPRVQRFATAAAPAYLNRRGRPAHPRDLLGHACLRGRFSSGTMPPWEFERDGKVVRVDPTGPLLVGIRRGERPRRRSRRRRHRHHLHLRRLAAPLFQKWRARSCARAMVAALLGNVPLLPRTASRAGAAAGLYRFRQSIG